jgi:hypothetical protein
VVPVARRRVRAGVAALANALVARDLLPEDRDGVSIRRRHS